LFAKRSGDSFTGRVQFEFNWNPARRPLAGEFLAVRDARVPLLLVRNPRARRYVLRMRPDGSARVTIPRGGSAAEARRFAQRNGAWVEQQLRRLAARPPISSRWRLGDEILFRGETVSLSAATTGGHAGVCFGGETVKVADPAADLRPAIERHLWRLAAKELPPRVHELAAVHQSPVRRISVRNQRSRWGSCSRRGTISLNWRLIQAPAAVRDYLILHELMHLREMNHSERFWARVAEVCPGWREAEHWLKRNGSLLGM
jgi:predicted metal-dependent hydrolase